MILRRNLAKSEVGSRIRQYLLGPALSRSCSIVTRDISLIVRIGEPQYPYYKQTLVVVSVVVRGAMRRCGIWTAVFETLKEEATLAQMGGVIIQNVVSSAMFSWCEKNELTIIMNDVGSPPSFMSIIEDKK